MSEAELHTDWVTTEEARKLLGNCSKWTVLNHMNIGTRTPRGSIQLRFQQLGGRKQTTRTWIAEYLAAITTACRRADAPPQRERVETPEQATARWRQAQERVRAKLNRQPVPKGTRR